MGDATQYVQMGYDLIKTAGPRILLAVVTLVIGLWIVKGIVRGVKKGMAKSQIDLSLGKFLTSLVSMGLKALLFISVIQMVGVQMTSFVAILGAAGLAVGLSLQGSLSNFAGGVLILLFKPYKVGDYIEAGGHAGVVKTISVFTTIMKTPDNKTIIIPNGDLSNSSIVNYSTEPRRRVDLTFGIAYEDDIQKAREVMMRVLSADTRILKDPAPQVSVSGLGDSSVDFVFRVWVETADYWAVYFDMIEKVKIAFDKEGISIPFPQRDVHLYNH
ncbi:MAG TPA: mechanosensitive ion channel domain-containing protein [Candidatus Krumholzibacterium sp.]|nr:mechanosensitive ion channel domain-containing protein [Candidatus Krumholzibacterium sp.]